MWRRIVGFIGILGCSILVTPLVTAAQQTGRLPRIIVLYGSPREIFAPVAKVLEANSGTLGTSMGGTSTSSIAAATARQHSLGKSLPRRWPSSRTS